eukprot:473247-Prymnesium_polylepis.1
MSLVSMTLAVVAPRSSLHLAPVLESGCTRLRLLALALDGSGERYTALLDDKETTLTHVGGVDWLVDSSRATLQLGTADEVFAQALAAPTNGNLSGGSLADEAPHWPDA